MATLRQRRRKLYPIQRKIEVEIRAAQSLERRLKSLLAVVGDLERDVRAGEAAQVALRGMVKGDVSVQIPSGLFD